VLSACGKGVPSARFESGESAAKPTDGMPITVAGNHCDRVQPMIDGRVSIGITCQPRHYAINEACRRFTMPVGEYKGTTGCVASFRHGTFSFSGNK